MDWNQQLIHLFFSVDVRVTPSKTGDLCRVCTWSNPLGHSDDANTTEIRMPLGKVRQITLEILRVPCDIRSYHLRFQVGE